MLSVVIPAYNEDKMIATTAKAVSDVLTKAQIPYEIIFVNDGSKDATWQEIVAASERNPHVRGACFSRNFGKEAAIYAGLFESAGDCTAVMDCDLQHPPEKLVEMYRLWQQGYQVIEGVKTSRGDESGLHAMAAAAFYGIISKATGIDMSRASDFKLLDRQAVNVLLNMKEKNAFFRALSSWIGFRTTQVEFDVQERAAGVSKWSTSSLFRYAITNIASFTAVPMQIVTVLGVLMFLLMILQGVEALITYFRGTAVPGYTTMIILELFTGSIIMISLGIIGYYISKIYEEVKGRPKFIISERTGATAQRDIQPGRHQRRFSERTGDAEQGEEQPERHQRRFPERTDAAAQAGEGSKL